MALCDKMHTGGKATPCPVCKADCEDHSCTCFD